MKFLTLVFTVLLFVGCGSDKINPTTQSNDNIGYQWRMKQSKTSKDTYIKKCYPFAINESLKHNISISIILAIDVLETNYGTSATFKKTHNHFGVLTFDTLKPYVSGRYKIYTDVNDSDADYIESYKDFGEKFIKYYSKNTVGLNRYDYSGWITMLHKSFERGDRLSERENTQYINNLAKIITEYKLDELDIE